MSTTQATTSNAAATVGHLSDRAARKAEQALDTTQSVANDTLNTLKDGVSELGSETTAALSRAAAQVQDLTRKTLERAREMGLTARDQASRAGDRTVSYIRDEPVKAVLIAAAVGAGVALLTHALRSRQDR